MTIQLKVTEQYFPVVLFIMLYKVVLPLGLQMKSLSVTIQMKATKQFFPVVLFIMLYKVVLTFESVGEILKCDYSNESYCMSSILSSKFNFENFSDSHLCTFSM